MAAQANEFGDVPVKKATPNEFGDLPVSAPAPNPQFEKNQQIIARREAQQPQGSALSRFGKGLYDSTIGAIPETLRTIGSVPLSFFPGETGTAARETINRNLVQPQLNQFRGIRAMGPVGMKDVPEIAGRALAGILPMAGPMAAGIGEKAGSGDIAGAAGNLVGAALPAAAAEVPVSRLRSPVTFGEPRLPSLSEVGQKAGIPIRSGPATAIPYAVARQLSGVKLRSPIGPVPTPPENYAAPYLDPQGPADLRAPSEPYEPPYLPVKGPEPPPPVSRNPSWRGLAPQAEAAPTSAPIPATAMPSGRVPGNGIPKPAPPAENFQPPYLSPHGPPAEDFVPPYLDPQGPFSEAHAKGIAAAPESVPTSKPSSAKGLLGPPNPAGKQEVTTSKPSPAKGLSLTPVEVSKPAETAYGSWNANSQDYATALKNMQVESGAVPETGIVPAKEPMVPSETYAGGQRSKRLDSAGSFADALQSFGIPATDLDNMSMDQWKDLAKRQGHDWPVTEVARQKLIRDTKAAMLPELSK